MSTLTLYELSQLVSETLSAALPDSYWVEAELSEVRMSGGHCYMTLVQKDLFGATAVARASAKCWRNTWPKVERKFTAVTRQPLSPGMKVLLLVSVDFHPAYGYSLIVSDIDPVYTLGDMAQQREEIIRQLKEEGVYDLQRELSLPRFCQRIAVVSSATAAGYGDFCDQLHSNPYGISFATELFPAVMQGEQVEASIISALDAINARSGEFDCVVIIRGGGAVADMSGFDTLLLAENVANFPLPIITGIGHERDECVLDLVAFRKVKTPTAAAAFLIECLVEVLAEIEQAEERIVASVVRRLERERMTLDSLAQKISSHCSLLRVHGEAQLAKLSLRVHSAAREQMLRGSHRLELLKQRVESLDPRQLLKRGYSMTTLNGQIVKNATQLRPGDEITTHLAEGKIESIVK